MLTENKKTTNPRKHENMKENFPKRKTHKTI